MKIELDITVDLIKNMSCGAYEWFLFSSPCKKEFREVVNNLFKDKIVTYESDSGTNK
jgi:hypothetical protein